MAKSEKKKIEDAIDTFEVYNDEQKFWHNVAENCTATIEQFKNSIKLNENIKEMAIQKLKDAAD